MSNKQQQQQHLISEASSSSMSGGSQTTVQEMNVERDSETERRIGQVFRTMLFFTTLMVLGPILTYFYSRTYIFEDYFQVSKDQSYIYSAIAAVVVVHIIVGAFIWVAWQDANAKVIKKKKQ